MTTVELRVRATKWVSCGAMVFTLGACSSDKTPASDPVSARSTANPPVPGAGVDEAGDIAGNGEPQTTVQVSGDLQTACELPGAEEAPKFGYNQAALRPSGANVLDDVARCMTAGPLAGHTITVIGRTDPRGDTSYNEQLGENRADAVRNYLVERGVRTEHIRLVSRGEQGARGNDEATWALDRRVDLRLGAGDAASSSALQAARSNMGVIVDGVRLHAASPGTKASRTEAASYADTAEAGKATVVRSGDNATQGQ